MFYETAIVYVASRTMKLMTRVAIVCVNQRLAMVLKDIFGGE